jgi:prepilin-type N-terminal cleavage/methylation domain-containing protein
MVRQIINDESGYTVVEVLIALTITSIVLGIVGTVFVFISGQMNRWQDSTGWNNEVHLITQRIHDDFYNSEYIMQTDTSVVILRDDGQSISYSGFDYQLQRNGTSMSNQLDSMYVKEWGISDSLVTMNLRFVSSQKSFESTIQFATRKPSYWEPMR